MKKSFLKICGIASILAMILVAFVIQMNTYAKTESGKTATIQQSEYVSPGYMAIISDVVISDEKFVDGVTTAIAENVVVDTGELPIFAIVSMTTKNWINEMNLVVSYLPPSNEFAFSDTGQNMLNVSVSKTNYVKMDYPMASTLTGKVLLCYAETANSTSSFMVNCANQKIQNLT